jgi:ribosomal protein L11
MKKLFLTLAIAGFGFIVNAQPPAGEAKPGEWYGDKVNPEGALNINDVVAKLNGGSEFPEVKVTAKIVEVCPKKGCWLKLELNDGSTATVKMKDYGFFLPVAAKGKTVVIDGEVKIKTTSVAELKHYAEDAKKSKEEIDAITKPEKAVSVLAKGIVIVE